MKLSKLSINHYRTNKKNEAWQGLVRNAIRRLGHKEEVLKRCQKHAPKLCFSIQHMFPKRDMINDLVLKLQFAQRKDLPTDVYSVNNIPFHLRDNAWLATFLQANMENYFPTKSRPYAPVVQAYPVFLAERFRYERDLAGELIYYMMHHDKPNALVDGKTIIYHSKGLMDFDKIFRQQAINTLCSLGLDEHESEVLVELNADKWRSEAMSLAFENKHFNSENHKAHEKAWTKYREYQYGQEHARILKELNLFTKNMQMSAKEVAHLENKLKRFTKIQHQVKNNNVPDKSL